MCNSRLLTLLVAVLGGILLAGSPLIDNADFNQSTSTNLPKTWHIHGSQCEGISIEHDETGAYLQLHIEKQDVDRRLQLYQHLRTVKALRGASLNVQWEASATVPYLLILESTTQRNGRTFYQSSKMPAFQASEQFTCQFSSFKVPENAQSLIITIVLKQPGTIKIKNINITQKEEITEDSKGIPFPFKDGHISKPWIINGNNHKGVTSHPSDGNVILRLTNDSPEHKIVLLYPFNPTTMGNRNYEFSYQVKSPTESICGIYAEWFQNQRSSCVPQKDIFRTCPREWNMHKITFRLPKNISKGYLAIVFRQQGMVELKNINLKALTEPTASPLGGTCFWGKHSTFEDDVLVIPGGDKAGITGIPTKTGGNYRLSFTISSNQNYKRKSAYVPYKTVITTGKKTIFYPGNDVLVGSKQKRYLDFTAHGTKSDLVFAVKDGAINVSCFSLQELVKNPLDCIQLRLTSPCFRKSFYSSNPEAFISGYMEDPQRQIGHMNVSLTSANGEILISQHIKGTSFSMKGNALPYGTYTLTCSLFDRSGTKLKTISKQLHKLAPNGIEYVIDNSCHLRLNGKPTLVVGAYNLYPVTEASFYHAARQGINLLVYDVNDQMTNAKAKYFLKLARKMGIYLMFNFGTPKTSSKDEFRIWCHKVEMILDEEALRNPALLGYYYADEPMWGGIPLDALNAGYKFLAQRDPYRLIYSCEAPRGDISALKAYSQVLDVTGADIYPVPNTVGHSGLEDKTLTAVGRYTHRMLESVDKRKPVWMVLQGFSWKNIPNAGIAEAPYPTLPELRFMAYDAMVNGSKGILFWGCQYIQDQDFYHHVFQITAEMHEMSGVFVYGQPVQGVRSSHEDIKAFLYDVDGQYYLVLMNVSDEAKHSNVTLPLGIGDMERVDKQQDARKFTNGVFLDAYEVRVYGTGSLPSTTYTRPPSDVHLEEIPNPVIEKLNVFTSALPYKGTANWIWGEDKSKSSKTFCAKTFEVERDVRQVILRIFVDDFMDELYVNGKPIRLPKSAKVMRQIDITSLVSAGENFVYLVASDCGYVPCGILAEIRLLKPAGDVRILRSDTTWLVSNRAGNPKDLKSVINWPSPVDMIPYGEGAWGKHIRMAMNVIMIE